MATVALATKDGFLLDIHASLCGVGTPNFEILAVFVALTASSGVLLGATTTNRTALLFILIFLVIRMGSPATLAPGLGVLLGAAASRAAIPPSPGRSGDAEIDFPFVFALILLLVGLPAPTTVGRLAALAGDLPLFLRVHRGESTTAMLVGGLAVAMGHASMPIRLLVIARCVMAGRLAMVVGGGFVVERGIPVMGSPTALAADLGHMIAVAADRLAAAASGFGRLLRIEFMCRATAVSGPPAFAGDLALLLRVHGSESAFAPFDHRSILP
jgi:hypothetical protein